MSIIYSKTQDGALNVLVAGKVTRDAEVKQSGNVSRVRFSICYDKKAFMDCEAFADSDVGAIAACLEKGDYVAVMGKHRTWEYNEKQYASLSADFIFTMGAPIPVEEHAGAQSGESGSSFNELSEEDGELPF